MKFIVGEVPVDSDFVPKAEGWLPLTKPRFITSYLFNTLGTLLLGSVFLIVVNFLLVAITGQGFFDDSVFAYYLPVVFSFFIIPLLHEVVRILVIPLAKDALNVVMPNEFLVWLGIAFSGELNRNRILLILGFPFLVLSLLPVLVSVLFGINSPWLSVPAFVNGLMSSTDMILIYHILRQTSKDSLILVNGLDVYYKLVDSDTKGL